VLLDIENVGIAVRIVLLYVYKPRNTLFYIYFRFQVAIFYVSLTLKSSCTNIRPTVLFDAEDMRIPLKFHMFFACNVRNECFRFHSSIFISGWTRIELYIGRCCYQQRWLRHPQKQTQQRWICFQRRFTSFDLMVTKCITFTPKNHPPHLHFRWLNSIMGWAIAKVSTSCHHALVALWMRRSAMENSDGQLRYSRKTRGCSFCTPSYLRVIYNWS